MKFCQNILDNALDLLTRGNMKYQNSILLGDNSSGKSEVLRKYILELMAEEIRIYYIDAVNRYFDVSKTKTPFHMVEAERNIVKNRIKPDYFNQTDTFQMFDMVTDRVEMIYNLYMGKVQQLLKEFCDICFEIVSPERKIVLFDKNTEGKLSSGLQALVRIFLELVYLDEVLGNEKGIVVIDELDEFLSPSNAGNILPFLLKHFPHMQFVVSTHSSDLVRTAENCNIVILYDEHLEVIESNDFCSDSQVRAVFRKVFGEVENCGEETDSLLRILLNNKISDIWSREDETKLRSLDETKLTNAQKVLYRQIKEW